VISRVWVSSVARDNDHVSVRPNPALRRKLLGAPLLGRGEHRSRTGSNGTPVLMAEVEALLPITVNPPQISISFPVQRAVWR
jgi:hypothetical protein